MIQIRGHRQNVMDLDCEIAITIQELDVLQENITQIYLVTPYVTNIHIL